MCLGSIGWLRLADRWLLFKNRDSPRQEGIRSSYMEISENALLFKDRKIPGAWLGLNRHGLGIATAWGPVTAFARKRIPENFSIVEKMLLGETAPKKACIRYSRLTIEFGRSFNLLFANRKKAYELEQIRLTAHIKEHTVHVCKANNFEYLKLYNLEGERYAASRMRLKKLRELAAHVKSAEDLYPVLSYKSGNAGECICRQNGHETTSSVIIEVKGKEVTVHYVLNAEPDGGNYKTKKWTLK